tara:strand:- start:151 stop:408 length:258 start_codon:yes stop_codon:yes gene_type:complete
MARDIQESNLLKSFCNRLAIPNGSSSTLIKNSNLRKPEDGRYGINYCGGGGGGPTPPPPPASTNVVTFGGDEMDTFNNENIVQIS